MSSPPSYLIPGMKNVYKCPYYWGKMDHNEVETILKNEPQWSFLLINCSRSHSNLNLVFACKFPKGGISYYRFNEIMNYFFNNTVHLNGGLKYPVLRKNPFSLKDLARAVICDFITFDNVTNLEIPNILKNFLREYSTNKEIEPIPIIPNVKMDKKH